MARKAGTKQGSANVTTSEIEEMIRQRAQELCNKRGCIPGNDLADWLEAEKQIKKEISSK